MTQIIACTDINICHDEDGVLHGGLGIAFYRDQICETSLVRETSEHSLVTKYDTLELEWRAIRRAMHDERVFRAEERL